MLFVALFSSLVVFNNVTDYNSNFQFVRHVLEMDTTFDGNRGLWRAIHAPWLHHLAYLAIIAAETAVAGLAWLAAARLWAVRRDAARFNRSKGPAIAALTLGVGLWFAGFIAVGGEWFLMWQSEVWNGQQAAFRIAAVFLLILLFVARPEEP